MGKTFVTTIVWHIDKYGKIESFSGFEDDNIRKKINELLVGELFFQNFSEDFFVKVDECLRENARDRDLFWQGHYHLWQKFWDEQQGQVSCGLVCPCAIVHRSQIDDFLMKTEGKAGFAEMQENLQVGLDCRSCLPVLEENYKQAWRKMYQTSLRS
jgi:bacterioferritin-associated ferredoxin